MISESIMDSSFSVFTVSNMGRMAKLTIKWSYRAVLWTDEQYLLAGMWDLLQRIIHTRNVRSGTGESLETEMIMHQPLVASAPLGLGNSGSFNF